MAPHILVIDDRISLPRFIAMELNVEGYQVSIHDDGVAKLPIIRELNPDLIVLNWELRSASGLDICRRLSLCDNQIPIIVVTAQGESNYQSILELGVQACLTKPFSMSDLLKTIERCLKPENQRLKCPCR